jgi:hypothetical protein
MNFIEIIDKKKYNSANNRIDLFDAFKYKTASIKITKILEITTLMVVL